MVCIRSDNFVHSYKKLDAMLHNLKILKNLENRFCCTSLAGDHAFDLTNDCLKSTEVIANLGFQRILTLGQKNTALEKLKPIKALLQKNLIIMPGVDITKNNIQKIMEPGAKQFHALANRKKIVTYVNKVRMGTSKDDFVNVKN
ncbi:copper homeostasis protein cutC homolog [Linepithema humile]|uniref:copper homeostasis protein cutC homolog n=1 Tax=Linepithema humile TaxID=83485 RepID=UPI00351E6D4C